MNRINIFLEHIYEAAAQQGVSLKEMLVQAHDMGYGGLECDIARLKDREQTRELFDSCGMQAASIYCFYDLPHESREDSLRKMTEHLNAAEYFGTKKVMVLPGFIFPGDNEEEAFQRICGCLEEMCSNAKKIGITVMVEDFDDLCSPCCDIEGLERLTNCVSGLGIAFDTGNFAYVTEDAAEALKRIRQHIVHVHLKDRSRDGSRRNADGSNVKADLSGQDMYPCEAGCGYVGMESIVKELLASGYRGNFSVEHFGAADQTQYMRRSIENVQRWLREYSI